MGMRTSWHASPMLAAEFRRSNRSWSTLSPRRGGRSGAFSTRRVAWWRIGREDAARLVLHRRQAALERIHSLEGQLARVTLEDQALAGVGDRLESAIAVRSAHQQISAVRYDAAAVRATVTEALTGVSDEFSGLLAELSAASERAEYMESRADALDELVEIGVLSSDAPLPHLSGAESHPAEVEALLEQIRGDTR